MVINCYRISLICHFFCSYRDLYLDGNDLECEGVVELIKLCADHAETETYEKELEEKRKQEAAAAAAGKNLSNHEFTILY